MMSGDRSLFFSLILISVFVGCSGSKNVEKQSNVLATLDSGLVLEDIGEDGVAELVLPEMLTYSDLKKEVESNENLARMELGSELKVEDESAVSIIMNEEIDKEFPGKQAERIETQVPVTTFIEKENPVPAIENSFQEYIVQKNDSLMLVAYKFFRDFSRWRDIRKWNIEVLNGKNKLITGQKLKILVTDYNGRVWHGDGNPYLIRRGDYLSSISKKVYNGKAKYWVHIWENNNLLIRNPNKIYAGFTIYTPTLDSILQKKNAKGSTLPREVSSQ